MTEVSELEALLNLTLILFFKCALILPLHFINEIIRAPDCSVICLSQQLIVLLFLNLSFSDVSIYVLNI